MQEHLSADPPLWISETDERGNSVGREVIDAAHRIWERVLHYVRYQRHDVAPVAEILESACHRVARAKRKRRKRNPIRDLDSYLYWAFIRRYTRQMVREARIQYVDSVEAFVDGRLQPDNSWVSMLEDDIQLGQVLGYLEPKIRKMVLWRMRGDSWAEIGHQLGISAHNAEVQFGNAIKKARSRLLGEEGRGRGKK
jgi:RNA polymerase sigma factor (sigma-70 family)